MWIFWIVVILYALIFIYKTKTGSPYLPSEDAQIENMMKHVKRGDVVADVGAGDGRVLVEAVKSGAKRAIGYEIEPLVYITGWWRIKKLGMSNKVKLKFGDMWRDDFSRYDVVFVYQLERFADRFARKCRKEMKVGSLVISNKYEVKNLNLMKKDKDLFIYRV